MGFVTIMMSGLGLGYVSNWVAHFILPNLTVNIKLPAMFKIRQVNLVLLSGGPEGLWSHEN